MTNAVGLDYYWIKQSLSLAGQDFVFLKAFQGLDYGHEDWFYPEQKRVRNAVLAAVGWYHFGQGGQDPEIQADLFLGRCQPRLGEWLWLDWEWVPQPPGGNGVNMTTAQAAAWHQRVAQRFPNNPRGTYTSKNFLGGRSLPTIITSGALWYVYAHGKPPQWDGWDFYQEVINNFDHDTYNGTWQELAARSGQSGGDDMTDEEHEWLQRDTRIMNGILTVFGSDPEDGKNPVHDPGVTLQPLVFFVCHVVASWLARAGRELLPCAVVGVVVEVVDDFLVEVPPTPLRGLAVGVDVPECPRSDDGGQ